MTTLGDASISLIALILLLAAAAPPALDCTAARAACPEAAACAEAAGGVALAATQARADELTGLAELGATRFRNVLGREPARYAVFEFDDPARIPAIRGGLQQASFRAMLALPSAALRGPLPQGLPPPPPNFATARVVRRGTVGAGEPREETSFVPHELGHGWYAEAFWRDALRPPTDRYGSAAPDWMDEAAAIQMEDASHAVRYSKRLADGRSPDPELAADVSPEIPLPEFLSMATPSRPCCRRCARRDRCRSSANRRYSTTRRGPYRLPDRPQRRSAHLRCGVGGRAAPRRLRRLACGGRSPPSAARDRGDGEGLERLAHGPLRRSPLRRRASGRAAMACSKRFSAR